MGTTGLIFGVIVAAWLAYLVPLFIRRESAGQREEFDPASRFSNDVRIVREGSVAGAREPGARVSTPLTRRAATEGIRRAERRAAGRRRNVVLVLLVTLVAVVTLAAFGRTPWWGVVVPVGLLAGFLGIARVSVRAMHADFERRLDAIGRGCDEETVVVQDTESRRVDRLAADEASLSVELGMPSGRPGSLWDPLPITRPTYVSTPPVAGRTVRTIDLTAPEPVTGDNKPVVADAPEQSAPLAPLPADRPRAVGE
ncbi:MAG: hypothetical protein Q4F67_08345 [Propionibacteriaceae bacterium]|nr:hypothetical protein [Propionibacteriaceae bacterium]